MMKMNRDLVLVRLEKISKGGLILPESARDEQIIFATKGDAVSVGADCKFVKEGDFVHYNSAIGNPVRDESLDADHNFVVVSENDILCKR